MRFVRLLPLALLVAALFGTAPVAAQDFPKLTGRVVDQADLLPPADEAALDAKLTAFETRTKRQLVVATVSDLGGRDIGEYGTALGRQWAIGQKDVNNGALFLIAPNERRMRIEAGYGLEPVLTDAMSGRIIRDTVTPLFKAGDFVGGINAGTDAIITQIELPPEQARANAAAAGSEDENASGGAGFFFLIFWLVIFFMIILPMIRRRRRGKRYRGRSGPWGGPVIIWGGDNDWGSGKGSGGGWGGFSGGSGGGGFGGFSGGGGSFGGGGASGGW